MSALTTESTTFSTAGARVPQAINAIIEISAHSTPVKYEMDTSNRLVVDRFLEVPMRYPCNYGYVPNTLCDDGDALDILVVTPFPVQGGALIQCRPIGMLLMTDEKGKDNKILAVPIDAVTKQYHHVQAPADLLHITKAISYFFEHYKDLENKEVKIEGWLGVEAAQEEILASIEKYNKEEEKKR